MLCAGFDYLLGKKNVCGIYKITTSNFEIYIGQSKDISRRYRDYKLHGAKTQKKLGGVIGKDGFNTMMFQILELCEPDQLNTLERHYIKLFGSYKSTYGLNSTKGGSAWPGHTPETRLKMSLARKGKKRGPMSEQGRRNLSMAKRGKPTSANAIQAMRAVTKGRVKSAEEIEKLRQSKLGKKRPAHVCKIISEAKKSPMLLIKDCAIMEFDSMQSVSEFLKRDRSCIRDAVVAEKSYKGYKIYYL